MTGECQQDPTLPEWANRAQLLEAYLDGIQYERGPASVPEGRPGMLSSRLHASDESAGRTARGEATEGPRIHVRLELELNGLHPDAETSEQADIDDELTVFRAHLTYRAEYALAHQSELPPESERQSFIQTFVVPQMWLQMRHMADLVTAQSPTGRVLLPAAPPGIQRAKEQ